MLESIVMQLKPVWRVSIDR